MSEIKRYELIIEPCEDEEDAYIPSIEEHGDGQYALFDDYESERLAHEETKKQLKALEDAVTHHYDKMWHKSEYPLQDEIYQAIANSRARNKT